jgi:hypothetical protein
MWCVTVAVENIPWALMFKTEEKARAAQTHLKESFINGDMTISIVDDYGQEITTAGNAISGWNFEDMDKSKLAHIERALHHARMQQEGQKLAQADAVLRQGQHGPSIISPMGIPNGFPRQ